MPFTAGAQNKIRFAYSSVGPMAAGVWMAKEAKIFDKYGIQADVVFISSGPVVVQALLGGDLQGASAASNAAIAAMMNGAPIIGFGAAANKPYHRVFVQPEINRVEELRGKSMGVTRFGSITDNLTRLFLRKFGLENSVTVRQMGGTLEVAAAFQNKTIAAAVKKNDKVQITEMQNRLTMTMVDKILFPSGSADISKEGKGVLDKVVTILKDVKDKRIQVEGHTDNVRIYSAIKTKYPTNWELSTARATQVVRYLQEAGGLDPKVLSATGYAEYQPVALNDSDENKSKNRRIEIVLLPLLK